MRQLTSVGIYRTITVTCWLCNVDSGPECPGRSPLLSLRALRIPQKSCWLGQLQWPQGRCQQKQQTHLPGWPLPLGLHFNLCPYKSKINISKTTFSTCLSLFKETVKDCHYPNSFTSNGLAFKAFHLLLHSLPLAHSPLSLPADVPSDLPNRSFYLEHLSLFPVPFQIPPPLHAPLIFSISPKPDGYGASVCLSNQPTKSSPSLTVG